jgi:hypothetical protein
MNDHHYCGIRILCTSRYGQTYVLDCRVEVAGQRLPMSRVARALSDGYEWGYAGAGPLALAHALLAYELGGAIADAAYQAFQEEVVRELPRERGGEEWQLSGQQIRDWWHTRRLLRAVLAPLEAAGRQNGEDDETARSGRG